MSAYFDQRNSQFLIPEIKENGNHVVMTNVYKPPKKKLINIDTKFQEEYNDSSYATFTYNLPQKINDVKSINVPYMEVPYSFYNFSEQKGNVSFIITDDANNDEYVITLPSTNYDSIGDLISDVDNIIPSTITNNISITLDGYKTKISVSSGSYTFHWNVGTDYDKTNFKSRLGWYLGFREPSYSFVGAGEVTSESIVNINTTNYVFLVVDEFSQNHPNSFISPLSDSFINKSILARMQIGYTNTFGKTITGGCLINLISDKRVYSSKTDIYKLKIQLVDEWGKVLDLNKLDFSVVLEIEYE